MIEKKVGCFGLPFRSKTSKSRKFCIVPCVKLKHEVLTYDT